MTNCYTAPLPKFSLGRIVMTQSVSQTLSLHEIGTALLRHAQGDWGDVCAEDRDANESALWNGNRLFSVYHDRKGVKFWIMDVKAAFHAAIKATSSFTIDGFSTWPLLNEFTAFRPGYNGAEVTVKPDGFIRIHETDTAGVKFEHVFFLEVDRSSEVQGTLVAKAGCYRDYYRRGGFAVRSGAERDDFEKFPFRVLMVFKNAERRNNTAERFLQTTPPILTMVYLSTFAEVTRDPLGAIWVRPLDYREATEGTPFAPEKQPKTRGYQRQTARELFVEQNVRKQRILADAAEA